MESTETLGRLRTNGDELAKATTNVAAVTTEHAAMAEQLTANALLVTQHVKDIAAKAGANAKTTKALAAGAGENHGAALRIQEEALPLRGELPADVFVA